MVKPPQKVQPQVLEPTQLSWDARLKPSAKGLTPHFERIFREIPRNCQIKANEQCMELWLSAMR